jgi:hypothetical protein
MANFGSKARLVIGSYGQHRLSGGVGAAKLLHNYYIEQQGYRISSDYMRTSVFRSWSGARDLNPGPHGPEPHDNSSKHVGFGVFQFDSSSRRVWSVQICANLQPDYYMKYYRMLLVQKGSSIIRRRDRPGIGRRILAGGGPP